MKSIVFYNYFENVTDKFYMTVITCINTNQLLIRLSKYGSYNVSDINQIIDE